MFLNLTFDNPVAMGVNIIIVLVLLSDIIAGYKKGFLECSIKFVRIVVSMLIAYLLKGPVSTYLYTNLPFFNLGGIFKGVSSVNILIYEVIAFFLVFLVSSIILNIVFNLLDVEKRVLRLVAIIGVPNKIMGAIVGGLKSVVTLYFLLSIFFVVSNFIKLDVGESLGNYIVEIPILKNTFGSILDSVDKISDLVVSYEHIRLVDVCKRMRLRSVMDCSGIFIVYIYINI